MSGPTVNNETKPRKLFRWSFWLALVAFVDSVWLLYLHLKGDGSGALCQIGRYISCEALEQKAYSEWLGIPVPIYALLYYGLLLFITRRGAAGVRSPSNAIWTWILSWFGLAFVLYFAFVSIRFLGVLCPFCAVLYLLQPALAAIGWRLRKTVIEPGLTPVQRELGKALKNGMVWAFIGFSIVLLVTVRLMAARRAKLSETTSTIRPEEMRSRGPTNASIEITEFSDFECPACKFAAELLKEAHKGWGTSVRVVYKFYPLDSSCNPLGGMHRTACAAARAAYCSSLQGRFWEYHDWLFQNQAGLSESVLFQAAEQLGLNYSKFRGCFHGKESKTAVQRDLEEGASLGVNGTPTLFLNGRRYQGALTIEGLNQAIAEAQQ